MLTLSVMDLFKFLRDVNGSRINPSVDVVQDRSRAGWILMHLHDNSEYSGSSDANPMTKVVPNLRLNEPTLIRIDSEHGQLSRISRLSSQEFSFIYYYEPLCKLDCSLLADPASLHKSISHIVIAINDSVTTSMFAEPR